MNETLSDSLRSRPAPPDGARAVTALYVLLDAGRPLGPSSRHELEGVDRIELGRGERGAWRATRDGRSDLRVAVPDPRMSAVHGHLTRVGDRWVFQDAGSKNGATVDGEPVRCAAVAAVALLGLGRDEVGGGFWTPSTALGDRLLERLEAHAGLRFDVLG